MTDKPLMARATAVWLVDNTTLNFKQIGDFCGMHELEVQGIADGEVAQGVKGFDPIANNQLTLEEIKKAESDPFHRLKLKFNKSAVGEEKRRGPRYTPLSKRQDRPAAIYWLVKFHPELSDGQIAKLVGTTKPTIQTIRERTHWNIQNIDPVDPVALGLCRQSELDAAIQKANEKRAREGGRGGLRVDVRGLAALYSGRLSPEELRVTGLLDGEPRDLAAAALAFAGPAPWMPDMF